MSDKKVLIVLLRQPRRADPDEMRSDPFWEFGSFGCTGCHGENLMNLANHANVRNARLAFAQGGNAGFKLVYLSPPVEVISHKGCCEAQWKPAQMPFQYDRAPLLVDNAGKSDFSEIIPHLADVNRETWQGRFASRFRSRRTPVSKRMAENLVRVYEERRESASEEDIAGSYVDALPYPPSRVDRDRKATYEAVCGQGQGSLPLKKSCGCRRTHVIP